MASSRRERRQQNISQESYLQEVVVKPRETAGVPSSRPVQTKESTRVDTTSLMEKMVERGNMLQALSRVTANKGAPGSDGMTIKSLRSFLVDHWIGIREQLIQGTYRPKPVRRVEIPKPDGGIRLLGIPTVLDRLIQQALMQILTPVFEPGFSDHSYGFRPKRRAHDAVRRAQDYMREGYRYVVDMDLEKFFDRVNHDILMSRVARKVEDKRVLRLVRHYLEAGVMINGVCVATTEGTPQGGPLSPLLANIMLDDLDKELEKRGHRFVRYADDCNIYVQSRRAGERVLASVRGFVEGALKLKVNEQKSAVDRPWKRKFLGFSVTKHREPKIRLAKKTVTRLMDRVRELTKRSKSQAIAERIQELNTYLKGWIGYFRSAETPSTFQRLDEWIRRRLRMCLLKQWKTPQACLRNLVKLGLNPKWASNISGSRKGYWPLSLTPQVHKTLGLAYWRTQGLVSLVERYEVLRFIT